eukprot:2186804-Pleurochrysis_carterae.AAC.1
MNTTFKREKEKESGTLREREQEAQGGLPILSKPLHCSRSSNQPRHTPRAPTRPAGRWPCLQVTACTG